MISGPVFPITREGVRQMLRERPDVLERGLRIVVEDFDCSHGALSPVDAIVRDADGAAALLFVTDAQDVALLPRIIGAHAFVARNAATLAQAIPEADLRFQASVRCIVVGGEIPREVQSGLLRLQLPGLEAYEVESFRIGGVERFLLRSLDPAAPLPAKATAELSADALKVWNMLGKLLERLDAGVRLDGDRFSRRAIYRGRLLCEYWYSDGHVFASLPGGLQRELLGGDDVRAFGDQVMRRFLGVVAEPQHHVGGTAADRGDVKDVGNGITPRGLSLESLRASLNASRLTSEEYTALGEPNAEEEVPEGS
jgi:hypothetical protein